MRSFASFRKLVKLYAVVENLHAVQAQAAAVAVDEIARVRTRSDADRKNELEEAKSRLITGSRVSSLASDHTAIGRALLQRQLAALGVQRIAVRDAAAHTHHESRVELRQMERVIERHSAELIAIESRRMQAESDDRFLSRREWLRAKTQRSST